MTLSAVQNHLPYCKNCFNQYARLSPNEILLTETLTELYLLKSYAVPFLSKNQDPPTELQEAISSLQERAKMISTTFNIPNSLVPSRIAHHAFEQRTIGPCMRSYTVTVEPRLYPNASL
jgi:hypothetical protein